MLLAVEIFAIFILYLVAKYVFGVNLADFRSPRGRMIGMGMAVVFLVSVYYMLFDPGAIRKLGADAEFDPSDERRYIAASSMQPPLL